MSRLSLPNGFDSGQEFKTSSLDVLGAVSKSLLDADRHASLGNRRDFTVHPVAAAGLIFDTENANLRTGGQVVSQWITEDHRGINLERPGIRRVRETGPANQDRGPRAPRPVY